MVNPLGDGRISTWRMMCIPGGVMWATIAYYHFMRRGVNNPFGQHDVDWAFMTNKAMAITGVLLIAVSMAIGPMAHWWRACRQWAGCRREIGMAGFGWIVLHVLTTTTLLLDRFSWQWYVDAWLAGVTGLLALIVLAAIAAVSNRASLRKLGYDRWKLMQRMVHVVLLLAMVHYMAMGKPANWVNWWHEFKTPLPPGTLMLTVVVVICIAIRCSVWIPRPGHVRPT